MCAPYTVTHGKLQLPNGMNAAACSSVCDVCVSVYEFASASVAGKKPLARLGSPKRYPAAGRKLSELVKCGVARRPAFGRDKLPALPGVDLAGELAALKTPEPFAFFAQG